MGAISGAVCTALAALSGATDLAQLLVDDEADALQVNG